MTTSPWPDPTTNRRPTLPDERFTIDTTRTVADVLNLAVNFAIVVGEHPVIWSRTNGQTYHMTYRSRTWANKMLGRVRSQLPTAEVAGRPA